MVTAVLFAKQHIVPKVYISRLARLVFCLVVLIFLSDP
jgi:hypothetical protein